MFSLYIFFYLLIILEFILILGWLTLVVALVKCLARNSTPCLRAFVFLRLPICHTINNPSYVLIATYVFCTFCFFFGLKLSFGNTFEMILNSCESLFNFFSVSFLFREQCITKYTSAFEL